MLHAHGHSTSPVVVVPSNPITAPKLLPGKNRRVTLGRVSGLRELESSGRQLRAGTQTSLVIAAVEEFVESYGRRIEDIAKNVASGA